MRGLRMAQEGSLKGPGGIPKGSMRVPWGIPEDSMRGLRSSCVRMRSDVHFSPISES